MPIMMVLEDENDETIILGILVPLRMTQVKKKMRVKKLLIMCLMTDLRR